MKKPSGPHDVRKYTPAYQCLRNIISEEVMSDAQICYDSGINTSILSKIKYDQNNRIELRIFVSICVGINLRPSASFDLIESAGYKLQKTIKTDSCYLEILDHYPDRGSIEQCNEKLKQMGMPPSGYLGSQYRNFKNRK